MSKFKKHVNIENMTNMLIGTFVLMLLFIPSIMTVRYLFEYLTPHTYWFEYQAVHPVKTYYQKGDILEFDSEVDFKREIDMQWFDYMYCRERGNLRKYKTQVWPEHGPEPVTPHDYLGEDDPSTWAYTKEEPSVFATQCRICGVAVGFTPRFKLEKEQRWPCSDWFEVNR